MNLYRLLFYKIYRLFEITGERQPHIYGWGVTSAIVSLSLIVVHNFIVLVGGDRFLLGIDGVVALVSLVLVANYFLFWHKRTYLKIVQDFSDRNTKVAGIMIVLFVILIIGMFIITGLIYRARILG